MSVENVVVSMLKMKVKVREGKMGEQLMMED